MGKKNGYFFTHYFISCFRYASGVFQFNPVVYIGAKTSRTPLLIFSGDRCFGSSGK
jgi:hypothetical protein